MSAHPAPFRAEIIPMYRVRTDPVLCPQCGGNNLMLYGNMIFPHHEVMENGIIISKDTDWDNKENFELLAIDCLACEIRFQIQSDENFMLSITNSQLETKLQEITGRGKKPC